MQAVKIDVTYTNCFTERKCKNSGFQVQIRNVTVSIIVNCKRISGVGCWPNPG